jgi:hypothetical protein
MTKVVTNGELSGTASASKEGSVDIKVRNSPVGSWARRRNAADSRLAPRQASTLLDFDPSAAKASQ